MQSNTGHYTEHDSTPGYASYDGSGYGSPVSSRATSARYSSDVVQYGQPPSARYSKPVSGPLHLNGNYSEHSFSSPYAEQQQPRGFTSQPVVNGVNGGHFEDFKFHLEDEVMNHHISLNTKVHDQNHDVIGRHLLYETAMLDTQAYEILDMKQVDELKKEHGRLNQRIDAANRKLALESKVKSAAANLQRLYSTGKKDGRPDTPQSPDSPKRHRNSLLGNRGRPSSSQGAQTLQHAEDELAQSLRTVEELQEQIKVLVDRRQVVERSLLQHTAAVLAEQASKTPEQRTDTFMDGRRDELHLHEFDEFDGIRDILRGLPAPASKQEIQKASEEHTQQLKNMQERLEKLNSQLRGVVSEASHIRGKSLERESAIERSPDPKTHLESTFAVLENNVRVLQRESEQNKAHYAQVQDSAYQTRNAVEEQLGALNSQIHKTLQVSPELEAVKSLRQPPEATGHGYQDQLQYLEESVQTVGKLLDQHHEHLEAARSASKDAAKEVEEAQAKAHRGGEYETVLSGLWDLLAADSHNGVTSSGDKSPLTPLKEDFSIQAFSSRVQHLYDMANSAKEQQDILRRQIQQQRDLNGKSDLEKDTQIDELQSKLDVMSASHNTTQEELAKYMTNHEQAEREANHSRTELENVINELEQFRRTIDETQARQKGIDEKHSQISAERNEALQRQDELQQEMESLESEVVRLRMELANTQTDLERAYGSRKERQKEAGMAGVEMDALNKLKDQEIADLRKGQEQQLDTVKREFAERSKLLETELQDMTNEFQEMTRESLELDKERGQLESLIDGLRERCDVLEAQLGDEKTKWMGIKAPAGTQDSNAPKESTSVTVLRQEFKKMMREARAEGVRLIRAEQEERRKLEAELRKIRQAAGPMGRVVAARDASTSLNGASSTPSKLDSAQTNGMPAPPPTGALAQSATTTASVTG